MLQWPLYLCETRGSPRLLPSASAQPPRLMRAGRLLSPISSVSASLRTTIIYGRLPTRDILLGIVMITEYPLSVVFSICPRHIVLV